jgi:uncharacterized protein (UPF0261 family)
MVTIAILGILDYKGSEIEYLKQQIERKGNKTIVIDVSLGGESLIKCDVTSEEIARLGGTTAAEVRASGKDKAKGIMEAGALKKVAELYSEGKFDALISIGGSTATALAMTVMKLLPFSVPKLMVSSEIAMPGYATEFIGTKDMTVLNSVVDMVGLNYILKNVLDRAAAAICAMAEVPAISGFRSEKPLIAMISWGATEKTQRYAIQHLEERGYQLISFHAAGVGDRAADELIDQGFFDGAIDLATGGVSEHMTEGYRDAGSDRLEASGRRGIPQIVAPSGLTFTGCGIQRKHAEKYRSREKAWFESDLRAVARFYPDELRDIGKVFAEKLNKAKGPVKFLVPNPGFSSWERPGTKLWDPEGDMLLIEEIKRWLKPEIEVIDINVDINDEEFAQVLVETFDQMMKERSR